MVGHRPETSSGGRTDEHYHTNCLHKQPPPPDHCATVLSSPLCWHSTYPQKTAAVLLLGRLLPSLIVPGTPTSICSSLPPFSQGKVKVTLFFNKQASPHFDRELLSSTGLTTQLSDMIPTLSSRIPRSPAFLLPVASMSSSPTRQERQASLVSPRRTLPLLLLLAVTHAFASTSSQHSTFLSRRTAWGLGLRGGETAAAASTSASSSSSKAPLQCVLQIPRPASTNGVDQGSTSEPSSRRNNNRGGFRSSKGKTTKSSSALPPVPPQLLQQPESQPKRVEYVAETKLPTDVGAFQLRAYRVPGAPLGQEPCVIYARDRPPFGQSGVPVRIHDQCLTSEVFRSQRFVSHVVGWVRSSRSVLFSGSTLFSHPLPVSIFPSLSIIETGATAKSSCKWHYTTSRSTEAASFICSRKDVGLGWPTKLLPTPFRM